MTAGSRGKGIGTGLLADPSFSVCERRLLPKVEGSVERLFLLYELGNAAVVWGVGEVFGSICLGSSLKSRVWKQAKQIDW